mmetsp:Transcript_98233/g.283449  ORF Transcript_98233/g.283449 Transcript_98233/m.283449 type:complete len:254 (+) Transcript_98233:1743-2504(+)
MIFLVPLDFLLELLLQLLLLFQLRPSAQLQGLVLLVGLLQLLLQLAQVRLLGAGVTEDVVQLLLPHLVLDTQVLHLLLEVFLPALLSLHLHPLRLYELLNLGNHLFGARPLLLDLLNLLVATDADLGEHLCVLLQHVAVLLELVPLCGELRQLQLLLRVHPGAHFDPFLKLGDLFFVLVDLLLRQRLLLQGLLDELLLGLDVPAEGRYLLLVLGGRLHGHLYALRALRELCVEISDLLCETLLRLMGPHQGLV